MTEGPQGTKNGKWLTDDPINHLINGDRVTKGNVMDDAKPLTDEQRECIRDRFRAMKSEKLISIGRVRIMLGNKWSKGVISQCLSGKYRFLETADQVLRDIDAVMNGLEAVREAPARSEFVDTRVVLEVRAVANTAMVLETIGAVYGPAGIGKTLTLKALAESIPGMIHLTISDSTASVPQFFRELSTLIKVDAGQMRAGLRRAICERLRGTKRLITIDEAHLATSSVLTAARQLHDETNCPMLLVGLPMLARRLVEGRGDDGAGATLYSRVGISRDLEERTRRGNGGEPLFSVDDIKNVFAKSKVRLSADARGWLYALANMPECGGLRAATNALRLSIHVVQKSRKSIDAITADMLRRASRMLHGLEGAKQIEHRIEDAKRVA